MTDNNTAVGVESLWGLTSGAGTDNTGFGANALATTSSGNQNVAVGSQAAINNTSGSENVIIGYDTAPTLQTGSSNIIIGAAADVPTSSTSNYLNIGGVITGSMTGVDITLANGFKATTQSTTDNSTKLATTAHVSNSVTAANSAVTVQAATTANVSGYTYNNGSSGVGATLTQNSAAVVVIDGYTLLLNDRVLFKNQSTAADNGVYAINTLGTVSVPAVFTRATNYNSSTNINNSCPIPVVNGTTNALTSWLLTSKVTTVGTDSLTYTEFTVNPTTVSTNDYSQTFLMMGG